ncbi:hypothetical protein X975_15351, partial [Stegodyphus mimosarum]
MHSCRMILILKLKFWVCFIHCYNKWKTSGLLYSMLDSEVLS